MGSFHDSMASHFGAPMLFSHFGEKDENGQAKKLTYRSTGDAQAFEWAYTVSHIEFIDDGITESGEIKRIEIRTATIERKDMAADGVERFEPRATVTIDGEEWGVQKDRTRFGPTFVTLGLVRRPLEHAGGGYGSQA